MLSHDDIHDALSDLAARLADDGIDVTIHVIGGAAIALNYVPERSSTRDIDSWIRGRQESVDRVRHHVAEIADARGWPADWLNDDARNFIPEDVGGLDEGQWTTLIQSGSVRVVVASPAILFVMKLRAARGRRDFDDCAALAELAEIRTFEQAVEHFERSYPDRPMAENAHRWLATFFAAS